MYTFVAPLKKSALSILAFLLVASFATLQKVSAQSSSVFDANYFNTDDGKEPPLRVGKGFDITDTYRQTRFCFTKETCDPSALTRQDNAQKTSITLHYTKSESDYQALKTNGKSGKVSFLNLFSIGASTLDKYGYSTNEATERLVFVAKVDFGKFEFGADPVLSPEAQALVDQKDFGKFISMYGTHYINGVRKEASVYVVLTRRDKASTKYNGYSTSVGAGLPIPLKGTANFEVSDENAVNKSLSMGAFDLEIIVDGPSVNTTDLQSSISKMLSSTDEGKVAAIKGLISKTLGGISNHEEGKISQYYFAPFSLYQVEGIVWNTKKESQLVALNQLVVRAYKTKSKVMTYAATDYLTNNLAAVKEIERLEGGTEWMQRYKTAYNNMKPKLQKHLTELESGLADLEKTYLGCSQIGCDVTPTCCNFSGLDSRIATSAANAENDLKQIENVEMEAYLLAEAAFEEAKEEADRPDCEKQGFGILTVINLSSNPYRLYVDGKLNRTISGNETVQIGIYLGQRQIKAEQVSGYMFYATVNNRVANFESPCQELQTKIGFED